VVFHERLGRSDLLLEERVPGAPPGLMELPGHGSWKRELKHCEPGGRRVRA